MTSQTITYDRFFLDKWKYNFNLVLTLPKALMIALFVFGLDFLTWKCKSPTDHSAPIANGQTCFVQI